MYRIFQGLSPLIRFVARRAGVVLTLALILSVAGLYFAQNLRIDTDFAELLPPDRPSVQALENLREAVGGESEAAVAIQSPSFEANQRFAEDLIPRVLELQGQDRAEPYFGRVEYQRDASFMENNALYFATDHEFEQLEQFLEEQREQARLEANPFYFDLDEDEEGTGTTARELQALYQDLVISEYQVNEDSTILVVDLFPTGAQTDIGFIEDAYADLEALIARMEPASYHPEMEVTAAGRLLRQWVEVTTIQNDVIRSFGAGVLAVLFAVTGYFFYKSYRAQAGRRRDRGVLVGLLARTPVMALLVGIPLLMSLTWTFGAAYLAFGTLNLMTSTLALVLFGLGIDYGIHFFARYTEERAEGLSVVDAAEQTFMSTGQAIAVGALTTAAGLYVLTFADFRGFSEFGFIAGTGIIFALLAMTLVLPALLALADRWQLLRLEAVGAPVTQQSSGGRFPGARGIVIGSAVAVVLAIVFLPRLGFEYRFGELEPEYEAYNERQAVVNHARDEGNGRNPAYILLDDPAEMSAVRAALEEKAADTTSTILRVETLQDRFPMTAEAQQAKLDRVAHIRELLDDRYLREDDSEDMENLRRAAQTTEPIQLDEVPTYLKDRFTTRDGEVGSFVMIYPSVGLSDGRNSMAFAAEVGEVVTADGTVYHAASTSLVAADMLRLMLDEAPWMVLATFLIVALLMYLNFGSIRWAALALVPLGVGVLWMILLMEIFALQLNFYNLVVLPAVLGIGNDAGVHLVHRYREEGFGSIWKVLRSTGEHVTMGSLTTMIGFGGLLLSFHPGLQSIGLLAVVGIGSTLLAAVLFLPALLQWLEDRRCTTEESPTDHLSGDGAACDITLPRPTEARR